MNQALYSVISKFHNLRMKALFSSIFKNTFTLVVKEQRQLAYKVNSKFKTSILPLLQRVPISRGQSMSASIPNTNLN